MEEIESIHISLYKLILKLNAEIVSTSKLILVEDLLCGPLVSSLRPEAKLPQLASRPEISGGKKRRNYHTIFEHTHDRQITTLRIYK